MSETVDAPNEVKCYLTGSFVFLANMNTSMHNILRAAELKPRQTESDKWLTAFQQTLPYKMTVRTWVDILSIKSHDSDILESQVNQVCI
jgi:hypothetical protein